MAVNADFIFFFWGGGRAQCAKIKEHTTVINTNLRNLQIYESNFFLTMALILILQKKKK